MSIEFTIHGDNDPQHVADAIVRHRSVCGFFISTIAGGGRCSSRCGRNGSRPSGG